MDVKEFRAKSAQGFNPVLNSSQEFIDRLTNLGWIYLSAGDQAYTKEGLSLQDMFKRFDNKFDNVLKDFCLWATTRRIKQG